MRILGFLNWALLRISRKQNNFRGGEYSRFKKLCINLKFTLFVAVGLVLGTVLILALSGAYVTTQDINVDDRLMLFRSIRNIQNYTDRKDNEYQKLVLINNIRLPEDNTTGIFNFTLNARHRCSFESRTKSTYRVGIIVLSRNGNFHQRYTIRQTWAKCKNCFSSVSFVFLLGKSYDEVQQGLINREAELYNDIVQVNLSEKYSFLTYKSMALLEWFYRYCKHMDLYIKADDDTYIHIDNIIAEVSTYQIKHFFTSLIVTGSIPIREKHSSLFVSREQFSGDVFPPYCSGPCYMFSGNILTGLYRASLVTPFFPIEDAFICGVLATQLNVHVAHIHSPKFMNMWNHVIDCRLKHCFSVHHAEIKDIINIHNFLQENKCE